MNSILQLKGIFEQAKSQGKPGYPILPKNSSLKVKHLESLRSNLINLIEYWKKIDILRGTLVSVYYNKIAAKSNRIKCLLNDNNLDDTIVGVRFTDEVKEKHIITHYIKINILEKSISQLDICIDILNKDFDGIMTVEKNTKINNDKNYHPTNIPKNKFIQTIVDAYYTEKLDVFVGDYESNSNNAIITIFKTDENAVNVLSKVGINLRNTSVIDETTILLQPDDLKLLKQKAPYLISMAVSDLSQLDSTHLNFKSFKTTKFIRKPNNEPVIGVIDTLFDKNVYFSEWVEYYDMLSNDIPKEPDDYIHGTTVSSIIVDGISLNPTLDDGCGMFRVRHFGVSNAKQFSSFSILRAIEEIVLKNRDIKVWNLSLGSKLEINKNFISPEASILDRLQYENDIIFVIAGTNKSIDDNADMKIGAPADSINSIVVNSVSYNNTPAKYSRVGPVLSFFTKPDISYYGGDDNLHIQVYAPTGECFVSGTSYAAPWISRKMAYLINILGLSREVAKALLIHSSTSWEKQSINFTNKIGYGVVPKNIENVVQSSNDEIQFILSGISEKYNTYTYNLPIPIIKGKHPFVTKATLCYFPYCSRTQGVDYTSTEFDISFGRIQKVKKQLKIKSINNNYQSDDPEHFILEKDARNKFRKWDNVKHIREIFTDTIQDKKAYDEGLWGLSIKTKERINEKYGEGLKFGIIVSLKEIHGVNRIEDFIKHCSLRGWLVNKIDVKTRIDIYNISQETIDFNDDSL